MGTEAVNLINHCNSLIQFIQCACDTRWIVDHVTESHEDRIDHNCWSCCSHCGNVSAAAIEVPYGVELKNLVLCGEHHASLF